MPISRPARGPFELLVQAELHYRAETEGDKRLAMISYDNAIEITIITYLHLNKAQRKGVEIQREIVQDADKGFYSLLDYFYDKHLKSDPPDDCFKEDLVHFHRVRNDQYHGGTLTVPSADDIHSARMAALWIFSDLFSMTDVESEIQNRIDILRPPPRLRNSAHDALIDEAFEPVEVGLLTFRCSELLFAVDADAYRELGSELEMDQLSKDRLDRNGRGESEALM